MTDDKRYNGWTNYATWRVNLEFFDGWDADGNPMDADNCRETVREAVDLHLSDTDRGMGNIFYGWINAFLSDVDWREIANAVNEANGMVECDNCAEWMEEGETMCPECIEAGKEVDA
jgi:hypothetical protein